MKLKQTVLIMMAATLPLTSMAAASETIPVTKDTGAVVAQNNRHDVTYRLSSTATPEQNKKEYKQTFSNQTKSIPPIVGKRGIYYGNNLLFFTYKKLIW